MKKTLLYALAGAFAIGGVAETMPVRASEAASTAPRSLDEVRANVRGEAMTSLLSGQVDEVRHRRWHRGRHYHGRRWAPRRHGLRYVHRRGRWCGRWAGRRCYYTPRPLRPVRRALR